jgi:RimJ/RimL family protein N-acetyltransferase
MTRLRFENRFVRLEPLSPRHVDALVRAAADRSTFDLAPVPRDRAEMEGYVAGAVAEEQAGRALPFAIVRLPEDRVVGSIRLMNLEWWAWPPGPIAVAGEPRRAAAGDPPDVAELGSGWLEPTAQRTAVFTATSLLLLGHAFDAWRVHRLVIKTDGRNAR